MRKFLLIAVAFIFSTAQAQKQFPPKLLWSKCYGGSNYDDIAAATISNDSILVAVGGTKSFNGDNTGLIQYNSYDFNGWFNKLNQNGLLVQNKTIPIFTESFKFSCINALSGGGYIAAGFGGANAGDSNTIIKLDDTGRVVWQKFLFPLGVIRGVKELKNGQLIVFGFENYNFHAQDNFISEYSSTGNLLWTKRFSLNRGLDLLDFYQTLDNGFIIAGSTNSDSGLINFNHGNKTLDALIIKLDSLGNTSWAKVYGGSLDEEAFNIVQLEDSSYVFCAVAYSIDGNVVAHLQDTLNKTGDAWLVKLDKNGNVLKSKCFGSSAHEGAGGLLKSFDKNILFYSDVNGIDGDLQGIRTVTNKDTGDVWVAKIDSNFNLIWSKCIGGSKSASVSGMKTGIDGRLYLYGRTLSNGIDINNWHYGLHCYSFWCDPTSDYLVACFGDDFSKKYPTLTGYIYIDHNSNNIRDVNEPSKANVKVQLSNGNYTFTDVNGYYEIQADSIGSYTLTIASPTGYNAVPASVNYNFTTWDTAVTRNIALQSTATIDSVFVNCIPLQMQAVQGDPMYYWLQYGNAGTTTLSPTANITYNNYLLIYDSCSDASAVPLSNGLVSSVANMQPGVDRTLIGYFSIKSTTPIGDTLHTQYGINTTTLSQSYNFDMLIEGSVAANTQRATQSLTKAQVAAGLPITYTIGFKNTGVDTAYNIIITDSLSSLLQSNTVQIIASSHKCKTTVTGNLIKFELLNIKLPRYTQNKLKSMGFVSFTVVPKTNLAAGTVITNKSNTYYNYRTAQSTTATTVINNGTLPLFIKNYSLKVKSEREIENIWTTANEVNVSHYNIQRSINGKDFENIGKLTANNKSSNEYSFTDELKTNSQLPKIIYYCIEAIDFDGSKTYSETQSLNIHHSSLNIIEVYPNPAKDYVTIESKEGIKEVKLINAIGQIVKQQVLTTGSTSLFWKVGEAKGLYLLQVVLQNGHFENKKLIIE